MVHTSRHFFHYIFICNKCYLHKLCVMSINCGLVVHMGALITSMLCNYVWLKWDLTSSKWYWNAFKTRLDMFKMRKKYSFYWILSRKTSQNDLELISFFKNESIIVLKETRRVSLWDIFNLFLTLILSMFQDRKKTACFNLKMRLNLSHYFW